MYSILGWMLEVVYCSVPAGKYMARGFLYGPYCPIYGIGAIFALLLTEPFVNYPPLVFLISTLAAAVLEYFTGWLMESLFQVRWWDYTNERFNIKGRICLKNLLLFGLASLFAVYFAHPAAETFIGLIPGDRQRVLASVIIMLFFVDLFFTLNSLLKFTERIRTLHSHISELEPASWFDKADLTGSIARLKEKHPEITARIDALSDIKLPGQRLIKSFPHMRLKGFEPAFETLRNSWEQRKSSFSFKSRVLSVKSRTASFFTKLNFYKLFWIFVSASVWGYVVETAYCLVKNGVIESRQGLIYGPFSQVYGFGAVLAVVLLVPLAKKSDFRLFFGSALVGGFFEYICSWLQEIIFGTVSWEYSDSAFSVHGRTSLLYMIFWGILGLMFIKHVYPALDSLLERIHKHQIRFFTWLLAAALSINIFLSSAAVYRWTERQTGVPAYSSFDEFFDIQYPDEFLEEIYPNMINVKGGLAK